MLVRVLPVMVNWRHCAGKREPITFFGFRAPHDHDKVATAPKPRTSSDDGRLVSTSTLHVTHCTLSTQSRRNSSVYGIMGEVSIVRPSPTSLYLVPPSSLLPPPFPLFPALSPYSAHRFRALRPHRRRLGHSTRNAVKYKFI